MAETETVRDVVRKRIAANLRAARERSGLAQPAVAERMRGEGFQYSQQTVARIETGTRKADGAELYSLARIYEVSLGDLVRPEGLALQAWDLINAVRRTRDASRRLAGTRSRFDYEISLLRELVAAAEGHPELEAELKIGRRALADIEAGRQPGNHPGQAPPDSPPIVRDNWTDKDVREIWGMKTIPPDSKVGLISALLIERTFPTALAETGTG